MLVNKQGNWIQTSCCCCSCCSLTSPELLKHQVEFVFLFKELDQLQDVTTKRIKKKQTSEAAIIFSAASVHRARRGLPLPVSLTLVQHLHLAEDTAAAVTRSLLDDLGENITNYKYPTMQTCLPYMFHGGRYQGVSGKCTRGWWGKKTSWCAFESISELKVSPLTAPQKPHP